jgi:predicted acetyltransferase
VTPTVGRPHGRDDLDAFSDILTDSLNFPPRAQADAISRYDPGDIRVVRDGERVAGGLVFIPTGQFFGGQRIPMIGIHAVAVAPERRGSGVGRALLRAAVGELAAAGGPPIACLYPATQPLYRSVGFEQAGTFTRYRVPVSALPIGRHELPIEKVPSDTSVVAELLGPVYGRFARRHNGFVDRTAWFWRRQVDPLTGEPPAVYAVRERGAITGYAALRRRWQPDAHGFQDIVCRDFVAETPAALARLVTLIADERSLAQSLVINGPPAAVDHMLLLEQSAAVEFQIRFMLRILDVAAALEARGYPPGLTTSVGFEIEDQLVAGNNGNFALEVVDGRGRVARSAAARGVAIGIRGLASLFSGFAPAEELARAGLASGPADALAAASAIFAGPAPWLAEIF